MTLEPGRAQDAILAAFDHPGANLNAPRDLGFVAVSSDMANDTVLSDGDGPTERGGFYDYGGGWSNQTNRGIRWLTAHASTNENAVRVKTCRLPTAAADGTAHTLLLYEVWTATDYVETRLMTARDDGAVHW